MSAPVVRSETPADHAAASRVHERAFGAPLEARLVERLRQVADPWIALSAFDGEELVGHVVLTAVEVRGESGAWPAIALGPMAVDPGAQNRGIGTALGHAGLEACRAAGHPVVFVLGHPDYYPRFGFRPSAPLGIRCEFEAPPEAFLVVELEEGALAGRTGTVHYHPEFSKL